MADAYTTTSTLGLDQTAYDRFVRYALRPLQLFDGLVDVMPTNQSMPGSAVTFRLMTEMAVATSTLSEAVDVDAVALADSTVTVTLAEYGNAVTTTALARGTAYVALDPIVANLIAYNAAKSIDDVIAAVARAGSNVIYSNGETARNQIDSGDTLTAADVSKATTLLAAASVVPQTDGYYTALIHPHVTYDLKRETGEQAWVVPANRNEGGQRRWNGEVGKFERATFVENASTTMYFANAGDGAGGAGNIDVYATIFFGREALAKAYSTTDGNGPNPRVVIGPVVDKLRRFRPIGWYHLAGYGRFREASIQRVESYATLGANT